MCILFSLQKETKVYLFHKDKDSQVDPSLIQILLNYYPKAEIFLFQVIISLHGNGEVTMTL